VVVYAQRDSLLLTDKAAFFNESFNYGFWRASRPFEVDVAVMVAVDLPHCCAADHGEVSPSRNIDGCTPRMGMMCTTRSAALDGVSGSSAEAAIGRHHRIVLVHVQPHGAHSVRVFAHPHWQIQGCPFEYLTVVLSISIAVKACLYSRHDYVDSGRGGVEVRCTRRSALRLSARIDEF
jgi:hypothetical protein